MMKKLYYLFLCAFLFIASLLVTRNYVELIEQNDLANSEDKISVLIVLNEQETKPLTQFSDNLENNQRIIMDIRKKNQNYFVKHNNDFVSKNVTTKGNVNISEYSPVIFIEFDDYTSYLKEKTTFQKLSKLADVDKIYVEETPKFEISSLNDEVNVNTTNSLKLVSIEEAKKLINVNYNSTYTGEGVNVGIIDSGYPNNTLNFVNNEIVDYNTIGTAEHTNKVASIIGGTYGIAPRSNLFIHTYKSTSPYYNFDDGIEWLLGKGVNVVNISMYSDRLNGNQGKYDGYSAYLDYIVWNNYLTIVKSAGNMGTIDAMVTNPGIGMNTISVGSIDGNKNISYYSSWNLDSSIDGILMKPTLVAPGENIIIPNTNNSTLNSSGTILTNSYSGTSFAAPMVTGIIALLMEEFPSLMGYPETYISALISGATKLPSQSNVWDNKAGAGLVNYEATREILNGYSYVNTTITSGINSSVAAISKEVLVQANKTIDYCIFTVQNSNVTAPSSSIYAPNLSNYSVVVYDDNNSIVSTVQYGENSNLIIGTINNETATSKNYTIKVYLLSKNNQYFEYLCLSIYNHIHSCYDWVYHNPISHKSICHCGVIGIITRAHVISSSETGNRYATCLECGYLLDLTGDMGIVMGPQNVNITKVSLNGSYILLNGIIVLSDEDIDAYFAGTLIFYNKDEVLINE